MDVARIYKEAATSVGLVIALDRQNQPLQLGSGFLIDSEGTFATNYHVIAGAQAIQVKFQDSDDLLAVQGIFHRQRQRLSDIESFNFREATFAAFSKATHRRRACGCNR